MKNLTHFLLILFAGTFFSACANTASSSSADNTKDSDDIATLALEKTTATEQDEKYLFPELEQVKYIRNHKIKGWSDIDKQSLFVSVSPKTSYLIILKRPSHDLPYAHGINFSSSAGTVYAKFDRIDIINIQDNIQPPPAYIDRIYEVKSREQQKMIRARIKGETLALKDETTENELSQEAETTE